MAITRFTPRRAGEHRGDGRLADPGRAADQHHQRPLEAVEPAPARVAAGGRLVLLRAQHVLGERVQVGRADLAAVEPVLDDAGELERPARRQAGRGDRLRHQPLRVRQAVALVDDDGLSGGRGRARAGSIISCGIAVKLDECVVDSHRPVADEDDAGALGAGAHRDRVDGGGLQLRQVDVAALGGRAVELRGERAAPGEVRRAHHRLGDVLHPGGAGGEDRDARVVRHAPRPARAACENGTAPAGGSGAPSAASTRSARASRYSANGSGAPAPRMQTVRSTSTGGMHAPEPSNTIAPGPSDAASAAPAGTFDSNGCAGEAAADPPAADRPHARDHGVLEVVGRRVGAAPRRSRSARRATARPRSAAARAGRPGPCRRSPGRRPARGAAPAQCPATAVFPVRLPVAITASLGPSKPTGS